MIESMSTLDEKTDSKSKSSNEIFIGKKTTYNLGNSNFSATC
jgi:hypothetical protein